MRPQKVSVDVWKMILGSCSYLALAFVAWLFLKLVHACFWLPVYLKKQDDMKPEDAQEYDEPDGLHEALIKHHQRITAEKASCSGSKETSNDLQASSEAPDKKND